MTIKDSYTSNSIFNKPLNKKKNKLGDDINERQSKLIRRY